MIRLVLTDEEARLLQTAIADELNKLRVEIGDCCHEEHQREMKRKEAFFRALKDRLQAKAA